MVSKAYKQMCCVRTKLHNESVKGIMTLKINR